MPTTPRDISGHFAKTAFTVLITGSRNWDHVASIRDEIVKIKALAESLGLTPSQVTLVHGNAQGADRTAATFGGMVGFNVISVPAEWNKHYFVDGNQVCKCVLDKNKPGYKNYCKMAGINRNLQMLNEHKPDMVLAFNRDSSAGTMHTITESRKRGLITTVVRYEDVTDFATTSGDVVPDGTSQPSTNVTVSDDPFEAHRV